VATVGVLIVEKYLFLLNEIKRMIENYKPRKVSSILKTDSKVSLVGKIVDVLENSFVLEDETGKVEIACEESLEKGKIVRVFCICFDGKLKADVVQDLKGLDLNLFKKVEELYRKEGLYV